MTINVGIYIYNNVEILDFAGPFEVFSTASRVKARMAPSAGNLFSVFAIGEKLTPIFARGELQILPQYQISDHPEIDLLIVPGGIVSDELNKGKLISWIKETSKNTTITASVCTGAFLLAKAGLLQSISATTHWEDIDDLVTIFPDINVIRNTRWVDEGRVVTSAGISAGLDMSLHLVSRLEHQDLATRTAKQMEYDWNSTI